MTFYFLLFTDFFNIETIEILDNDTVTKEEILLKSGLKDGQSIFRFNKGQVLKSIEKIPYIKNASLVRVFPNKIKIYINERRVISAFFYESKFLYVDDGEIILEYAEDLRETNIPIITISSESIGSVLVGNQVQLQPEWIKKHLFTILKLFKDEEILKYISEINITKDNVLHMYTKGGSIIKVKTSDRIVEKLDFIRTYLMEKDERMIIDLTHSGNPTYIPR
nr:FtsQ-type POTRA domain-containing protein [Alkalibaculum sporogenes]